MRKPPPNLDPVTLERNVPGIYVAGVILGGKHTGEIFIENGRFHGKQIINALTGKHDLGPPPVSPPASSFFGGAARRRGRKHRLQAPQRKCHGRARGRPPP